MGERGWHSGARPADQALVNEAPTGLRPAGFDPSRGDTFEDGVAFERQRVVAWLERHALANQEASTAVFHSSSPARTIDLRSRANSCFMHATWIGFGKHECEETVVPEAYSDALIRLQNELAAAQETLQQVRDMDYWEGSGSDLLDWVTLGYVENGQGRRNLNPAAFFKRRDSRSKPDRAETGTGSVHESDGAGTAIARKEDP